jgi:hypothetical protein
MDEEEFENRCSGLITRILQLHNAEETLDETTVWLHALCWILSQYCQSQDALTSVMITLNKYGKRKIEEVELLKKF